MRRHWNSCAGVLALCAALASGCATAPPKRAADPGSSTGHTKTNASSGGKSVWHEPKREIDPINKLNPLFWFGNADDPAPPPAYKPDDSCRHVKWHLRNSCHNFTFYIVGLADKKFERVGTSPEHVFNPDGRWNWCVSKYRWWRLPFVSYNGKRVKLYVGWRNRGNFGAKFNIAPPPAEKPAAEPLRAEADSLKR